MPTDKDKIDGMTLLPSESYSDPPSEDDPAMKGPESMKLPCVSLIGQLALDLRASFIWAETPQGHDYWDEVYQNLRKIGDE